MKSVLSKVTKDFCGVTYVNHYCEKTSILIRRTFTIAEFRGYRWIEYKISKMAKEHDLEFRFWASSRSGIVGLKKFKTILEFTDYIREKFGKEKYSFIIKGDYVKVEKDKAIYIYIIKNE